MPRLAKSIKTFDKYTDIRFSSKRDMDRWLTNNPNIAKGKNAYIIGHGSPSKKYPVQEKTKKGATPKRVNRTIGSSFNLDQYRSGSDKATAAISSDFVGSENIFDRMPSFTLRVRGGLM